MLILSGLACVADGCLRGTPAQALVGIRLDSEHSIGEGIAGLSGVQGSHIRATFTARYANRRCADRRVESRRKSVADPQGSTFELHETTQQALGSSHKFSRARSEKRDLSDGSQVRNRVLID